MLTPSHSCAAARSAGGHCPRSREAGLPPVVLGVDHGRGRAALAPIDACFHPSLVAVFDADSRARDPIPTVGTPERTRIVAVGVDRVGGESVGIVRRVRIALLTMRIELGATVRTPELPVAREPEPALPVVLRAGDDRHWPGTSTIASSAVLRMSGIRPCRRAVARSREGISRALQSEGRSLAPAGSSWPDCWQTSTM